METHSVSSGPTARGGAWERGLARAWRAPQGSNRRSVRSNPEHERIRQHKNVWRLFYVHGGEVLNARGDG